MSLILDEHRHYLADRVRVSRYAAAVGEVVRPGDVVLDLGSGTGILGLFAWRAGAARVYAIEASPIAGVAERVAAANAAAAIHVVRAEAHHAQLPERADVVVTDQIGRFGFEAGLFSLFEDARARLLKPDARFIPEALSFRVAPIEHARQYDRVEFWRRSRAGLDFSAVASLAENSGYPVRLAPRHLLALPVDARRVDLRDVTSAPLRLEASFTIERNGELHGLAGWFAAQLSPSVEMSNSPLDPQRILRRQTFLPIAQPTRVSRGDEVRATIRILPEPIMAAWSVTIARRGTAPITFEHSTLRGMLIDHHEMHLTDPAYRPRLTDRGAARRTVLELCDGHRTLAEIEAAVFERHGDVLGSRDAADIFVSEVVTRYTRDAS